MLVLPLKCKRCDWTTEIRSNEPLPGCLYCGGHLSPNGKPRPWVKEEVAAVSETSTLGLLDDDLLVADKKLLKIPNGLIRFAKPLSETNWETLLQELSLEGAAPPVFVCKAEYIQSGDVFLSDRERCRVSVSCPQCEFTVVFGVDLDMEACSRRKYGDGMVRHELALAGIKAVQWLTCNGHAMSLCGCCSKLWGEVYRQLDDMGDRICKEPLEGDLPQLKPDFGLMWMNVEPNPRPAKKEMVEGWFVRGIWDVSFAWDDGQKPVGMLGIKEVQVKKQLYPEASVGCEVVAIEPLSPTEVDMVVVIHDECTDTADRDEFCIPTEEGNISLKSRDEDLDIYREAAGKLVIRQSGTSPGQEINWGISPLTEAKKWHDLLVNNNVMTVNEVLEGLGFHPIEGGNVIACKKGEGK